MHKALLLSTLVALGLTVLSLGCGGDREIVVTRDQFGAAWPLQIASAKVVCSRGSAGALLKVGPRRYALDDQARSRGYPPASEIARSLPPGPDAPAGTTADVRLLRDVCEAEVAARR